MKFSFLRNLKITIMGIGLNGRFPGTVKFLIRRGAKLSATDLKTRKELSSTLKLLPYKIKLTLGKHKLSDFIKSDLILKNPAISNSSPFLLKASQAGVPVITDVGLFFLGLPKNIRVIGVTGTKGKTSVSRMLYKILSTKFRTAIVGIPGTSFLGLLDSLERKKYEIIVAELSSFDLEALHQIKKSPEVAVITNIAPDHLDRYPNMEAYQKAKSSIFLFQEKNRGIVVANYSNQIVRKMVSMASGKVVWFSEGYFHEESNLNAVCNIARIFGIKEAEIKKILKSFPTQSGHLEKVFENEKIVIINDTCATNPLATKMALRAISKNYPGRNIVIILGGKDKNLNFNVLRPEINIVYFALILPGDASKKISSILKKSDVAMQKVSSLEMALRKARMILRNQEKRGVILFSPSCASFNMFRNEFDRGEKFKKAVIKVYAR